MFTSSVHLEVRSSTSISQGCAMPKVKKRKRQFSKPRAKLDPHEKYHAHLRKKLTACLNKSGCFVHNAVKSDFSGSRTCGGRLEIAHVHKWDKTFDPRSKNKYIKSYCCREKYKTKALQELKGCGILCKEHHKLFDDTKDFLKFFSENGENMKKSKKLVEKEGGKHKRLVLNLSAFRDDAQEAFVQYFEYYMNYK